MPTAWNLLEDALLMIGLHVIRDEELLGVVEEFHPELLKIRKPFRDPPVELEKVPPADLADLRRICAVSPIDYKLVVTVFGGSSIRQELPVLADYPMEVEVCTVTYSCLPHGFAGSGPLEPSGSLTASWPDDGPMDDPSHDPSLA